MATPVEFELGVKSQAAVDSVDNFSKRIGSLGDAAAGFALKWKGAFSIAAIALATEKTAAYERQLQSTAQTLGTTAEKAQGLDLLAQYSNSDASTVTGYFDAIDEKRKEALKGNQDLIMSFQALGVSYKDLVNGSKSDLFSKVLQNPTLANTVPGSQMGYATENIFGNGSIQQLQAYQQTMGGQSLDEFTNGLKKNGQILSNEEVANTAQQDNELKAQFQKLLITLEPLANAILTMTNAFLTWFNNHEGSDVKKDFTGNFDIGGKDTVYGALKNWLTSGGKNNKSNMISSNADWTSGAAGESEHPVNTSVRVSKDQPFHGVVLIQPPTIFQGESVSGLKTGGVFGSGVQTRIIQLNTEMRDYLQQIMKNTSGANNPYTKVTAAYTPSPTNSGGI